MNPYSDLPDSAFWTRAVAGRRSDFDPIVAPRFFITRDDKVSTAGCCFAQHISAALVRFGFTFHATEAAPLKAGASDNSVFSARYGEIHTARQLLQLFQRAYGIFEPRSTYWSQDNGRLIDPFRPCVQDCSFADVDQLLQGRYAHLAAVRRMFETCDVFVFTLGMTEGWVDSQDGAVVPFPPGAVHARDAGYKFVNFSVPAMIKDLVAFITSFRTVNADVRVLLIVSPVPLVVTFEPRHVLVSTAYTKSALRVVADTVSNTLPNVEYFPCYEIVTGSQACGQYFEPDLRTVTPDGITAAMEILARNYLKNDGEQPTSHAVSQSSDLAESPCASSRGVLLNRQCTGARLAIIGNSQASVLGACLRSINPSLAVKVLPLARYTETENQDRAFDLLGTMDIILTQPTETAVYGPLTTANLIGAFGKVISYPKITFQGFHPDFFYIKSRQGGTLNSPCGIYHSRIVVAGYLLGLAESRVVQLFNALIFSRFGYFDAFAQGKQLLLSHALKIGYDLNVDFEGWLKKGAFMHTHIHPTVRVLLSIATAALAKAGLPQTDDPVDLPDPLASALGLPVYPEIAERIDIEPVPEFKLPMDAGQDRALHMTIEDFVRRSYQIYAAIDSVVFKTGPIVQAKRILSEGLVN